MVWLVRHGTPPLEALTRSQPSGEQLRTEIAPVEADPGPAFTQRLTDYFGVIMSRMAVALIDEKDEPDSVDEKRRRDIVAALLGGHPVDRCAVGIDSTLAHAYLVVTLSVGEPALGMLADVWNRVNAIPGVLTYRTDGVCSALIPMRSGDELDPATAILAQLNLPGSDSVAQQEFWLGVAPAPNHAAIPAAYVESRIIAELARCLRLPDLGYGRMNVMLGYTVATSAPDTRRSLMSVLAPLDDQPVLVETLTAFIDSQMNATVVGRDMFVHRNTVIYRLNRIADLTGLNPQHPAGISVLMAAQIARRLEASSFSG